MGRPIAAHLAIALGTGAWLAVAGDVRADAAGPAEARACAGPAAFAATARLIRDGDLHLEDGRIVRLNGVLAQAASPPDALAGRAIEILGANPAPDRWDRIVADAVLVASAPGGAPDSWLEASLVDEGVAIAAPRPGAKGCAAALVAREQAARAAGRGLWAGETGRPVPAGDLAALAGRHGAYTLVEGRVLLVGEARGTVYLNFGHRWSRDFTVLARARDRRAFAAGGIDLDALAGRDVRVRGHVIDSGGPAIELASPAQIEVLGRTK